MLVYAIHLGLHRRTIDILDEKALWTIYFWKRAGNKIRARIYDKTILGIIQIGRGSSPSSIIKASAEDSSPLPDLLSR